MARLLFFDTSRSGLRASSVTKSPGECIGAGERGIGFSNLCGGGELMLVVVVFLSKRGLVALVALVGTMIRCTCEGG